LEYNKFIENFRKGCEIATHKRQMRLDFTLTLPGLFEVERMQKLADKLGVEILAKVIFTFTPDIVMSPLALPRKILECVVDKLITNNKLGSALQDVLVQLKNRPTIQETFGEEQYQLGIRKGKKRILDLERIRKDDYTLSDILSGDQKILEWWEKINV
jgi:hypothetical protein